MYLKKQDSPVSNLSDVQYVFCGFDDQLISNENTEIDNRVHLDGNGVYVYDVAHCKHCHSRKVKKHGQTSRILYGDDGARHDVVVQRYYCPECGKYTQTEFNGEFKPYAHYSNSIRDKIMNVESWTRISLRNAANILKEFTNHPMSHETVRKTMLLVDDYYISFTSIVPTSGFYGFDTQWVGINSKWKYRHVIYDLIYKVPVAELFSDNEDSKTIKNFIEKTIPEHQRIGIVTDLKPSYNKIMDNLGFIHQHCQFHFKQIISKYKTEYLRKKEKTITIKYKKQGKSIQEVKKEINRIKNKIQEELEEFYELFNHESIFEARKYINSLTPKIKQYTSFLKNYIHKNFIPHYKKIINFLDNNRLDHTNNQTENFIGNTLPRHIKKIFRTPLGIINHILLRDLHWIKKRLKINKKLRDLIP